MSTSALNSVKRNNRVFMRLAICLRTIPRLYGDAHTRRGRVESSRVVEVNSRLPIGSRAISYTTHARVHACTHAAALRKFIHRSVRERERSIRARARARARGEYSYLCGLSHVRRSRKRAITGTIRYIPGVLRVQQLYTGRCTTVSTRDRTRDLSSPSATSTRFRDWEGGEGRRGGRRG